MHESTQPPFDSHAPCVAFQETIRLHFLHRRDAILAAVSKWVAEAEEQKRKYPQHATKLKSLVDEVQGLLMQL